MTLVAEVARAASLPDMYFLFNTGDQPFTDKTYWSPLPQFHWVRCPGHWTVPLPNPFHLRAHLQGHLGDGAWHRRFLVPWDKKIPKVFWRGSLSAPDHFLAQDLDTLPRIRLLTIAGRHPELFDVAVTNVDEEMRKAMSRQEVEQLMGRLRKTERVSMEMELPKHRYVINVSAVLSAWRLAEMLASGSLLLLQDDSSRELIYEWLTPWEHYVPVSNSLSDLVDKVRWLEEHQEQAQVIAERGLDFFQRRVRRQDTYCYLWQALSALSQATELRPLPAPAELQRQGWREVDLSAAGRVEPQHMPLRDLLAVSASAAAGTAEL